MTHRNRALAVALLSIALAGCGAPSPDRRRPSVAVETSLATWSRMDRKTQAYGTAIASPGGAYTVSEALEGQVQSVSVAAGDAVKTGQAIAVFQLSQSARGALSQAEAAVAAARNEKARVDRLLADQLASRDQQSQAAKALADALAAYQAASAGTGGQGEQIIRAPFDGVVTTIAASPGLKTAPGATLLTLSRSDALVVQCGVEPRDAARVAVGQGVELMALSGGPSMQGVVTRTSGVINAATRLVDIEVSTSAPLMKGQDYRAVISAGAVAGWRVPSASVQEDEQGAYLFQVRGRTAVRVPVQRLLPRAADQVLVAGALQADQPVVGEGAYQLSEGALVRATAAQSAQGASQ